MKIRNMIQQSYNIYKTNIINKIITILFCTPCAICQHEREMQQRGEFLSLTKYYFKNNFNSPIQQEMK